MQTLHTATLTLEPLLPAHAEEMFALLADPQLYAFLDYPPPPSVEHLHAVYARLSARRSPDGVQQWLNWIVRAPEGAAVGYVQATVEPSGDAWVAYVLGHAHRGRGFATAATRRMLEHLAEAYGAQRFLATVEVANRPSIALLQRLGFVEASAALSAPHDLSVTERLFVARPAERR